MDEETPRAAATRAPELDSINLEGTTVEHDLGRFLGAVEEGGSCIRCSRAVDPNSDDWSSFGQVDTINQRLTITGGLFCKPCVEGWNQWMSDGRS